MTDSHPSDAEYARVIGEMASLKAGQADTAGESFGEAEIRAFAATHVGNDYDELRAAWDGWVGEWLAARSDVGPTEGREEWIDRQYQRVLEGESREYGFTFEVIVPPGMIADVREEIVA